MSQLKTLAAHEAERAEEHRKRSTIFATREHPSGIACPKCGEEAIEPWATVNTSMRIPLRCVECGWHGDRTP